MTSTQADTQCSICLENYRNPKLLPCTHNFCEEPCLQILLNSAQGNRLRCPICRHEFLIPPAGISAFAYNTNWQRNSHNPATNNGRDSLPSGETEAQCSICLENFRNPKILPCTHNICEEPCLQVLLNSFRCPLCRLSFSVPATGTREFAYNTNLQRISSTPSVQNRIANSGGNTRSSLVSNKNDTRCSICLETLRNPKILHCLHNICEEPCLHDLLNSANGQTFRCPLCRQEFPVPSNGTRAFAYNRNFQIISPTRSEIPIRICLSQNQSRASRTVYETQFHRNESVSAVFDIHQPVVQTISQRQPSQRNSSSCRNGVSCTDCIRIFCYIAFILHYVGVSLARLGIIIYLFCEETVAVINYLQFVKAIINLLTALVTLKRQYGTAKVLCGICICVSIFGVGVFFVEWECESGVHNCEEFVFASRFFYVCDWLFCICLTVFLIRKTKGCCCCNCNVCCTD